MFANPEFKVNPYPAYRRLRENAPIHWTDSFGGAWLLPRYADVVKAMRDPRLSARRSYLLVDRLPREDRKELAQLNRIVGNWISFLDPPEHSRLRKPLETVFTPAALKTMRPCIEKIADSLLDKMQEKGEMEFMHDFAYPFPSLVLANVLGIPSKDLDRFIAWSDDFVSFQAPKPTLEVATRAQNSLIAITEYFKALLAERHQEQHNIFCLLKDFEDEEGELPLEAILAQFTMLIIVGQETTRYFLGNAVLALLQHPQQWEILKRDPSLAPNAVQELLRYESSVQSSIRLVTEEFELHGRTLKPGQFVISLIGSANRDPAKFTNPEILNITRSQPPHIAFGYGGHFCLGAALAHMESEIALNCLLNRMPNLKLASDTPDWNLEISLRGLNRLPVAC